MNWLNSLMCPREIKSLRLKTAKLFEKVLEHFFKQNSVLNRFSEQIFTEPKTVRPLHTFLLFSMNV